MEAAIIVAVALALGAAVYIWTQDKKKSDK